MPLLRAIALAFILACPVHASELPDIGEAPRAALSEAQEAKVGREIMQQIRSNSDYLDDAELTDYLNSLGDRLAASSADPTLHFEFFVIRDPTINAFALPGGYIGVHTGLLSAVQNESELAGVLAHEIGHVTQHHIARMVDKERATSLYTLAALAVAILASRSNSQVSEAALTLGGAASVQSALNFSRENEREADRAGLQTMSAAGFSPYGMVSFFKRLQAQSRLYDNNAPAYLRTHPLTQERIADMEGRVAKMPYHQHPDSLEFTLLRSKVQAQQGDAFEALKRFEVGSQGSDDPAPWYGLARAALRAGRYQEARDALARLEQLHVSSPLVDTLAADISLASGRPAEAVSRLQGALKRFSAYRPLVYAYVRALLRAGQPGTALAYVDDQLLTWPDDTDLFALKAEAHQALGEQLDAHLAQAEVYARRGATKAAIEQLQLALKSGEKDFYKLSIAEARMRELKERERQEKLDAGR
jgi:beta-barrel assembly-enhancing protease